MTDAKPLSDLNRIDNSPEMREQLWRDILVMISTNMVYQQTRRRILERRENVVKVVSLVLATGVFLDFKTLIGNLATSIFPSIASAIPPTASNCTSSIAGNFWVTSFLLVIVLANSWGLVFQWGAKSRDAAKRYDDWAKLDVKIQQVGLIAYTEEQYAEWNSEASALETGEAQPNRHLVARAEDEARRIYSHPAITADRGWQRFKQIWYRIPRFFVALS